MTRFIRPLAGIIAAVLLAAGGTLAYNYVDEDEGSYRVTAFFERTPGLFENSDVDVLGVAVGKILSVQPVGTRVKVEMEISDEYKLPADAFAQIIPPSVISDRYVQIAPPYEGGPALQDGAVLGLDRTGIPAELDDVFAQLKKLLDAIEPGEKGEPGALGKLIVQLDDTLSDREEDLQRALIDTSDLTSTLAESQDDLSDILVNLEGFFTKLATRADSIGDLNRNLAVVLTALAESRTDLEGTLHNVGDLTNELGDLVRDHRRKLGRDVELAAAITSAVLENRASVEESLVELPNLAQGLARAYHGGKFDDVDVRDNNNAKIQCDAFRELPDSPLKDQLLQRCREATGEPDGSGSRSAPPSPTGDSQGEEPLLDIRLDCDEGVRKVERQIRRITKVGLPDDVKRQVLKPLKMNLRRLAKECDELGELLKDPKKLLEELEVGDVPDVDVEDAIEGLDELSGSAAGSSVAAAPEPSIVSRIGSWVTGFLGFVGWGR